MEQAPGLANQRAVRRHNLGVVLRHVSEHGPRSRATIAVETGLNKTTVSSLVTELIGLDLLVERGLDYRGTVGRPGQVVELSAGGVVALGVEINVDYVAVRALDLTGEERYGALEARDNRRVSGSEVLEHVAALVEEALAAVREAGLRPVGATVGLPGLVDADRGVLLVAPNLGWRDVPVVDDLRRRLGDPGFPVTADNEANLAALAELWEGAARGLSDVLYVSGEIGVGAGLIVRGELFRGSRGFGGEFGHMTLDRGGRPCACGSRGCLETVVGQEAIARRAGVEAVAGRRTRSLTEELLRRSEAGDELVLRCLAEAGATLGTALASAINLFDLDAVVLGGCFGPLAPWLVDDVQRALEEHVLSWGLSPLEVHASPLGEGAAVRGAAAQALREVLVAPWAIADGRPPARVAVS